MLLASGLEEIVYEKKLKTTDYEDINELLWKWFVSAHQAKMQIMNK